MKLILTLLLVLLCGKISAQANLSDSIYTEVEIQAEFPGGRAKMLHFLMDSINFSSDIKEECFLNKIYVKFIVEEDGKISHVEFVRHIAECTSWKNEIMGVILAMPPWIPGKIDGKAVRSYFYLPINICYF